MIAEVLSGERRWGIVCSDVSAGLARIPDGSVHCVVTSPPYPFLRDYGVAGQIGMERTVGEYVEKMVTVFGEVRRVLRRDGTLWLNLGSLHWSQPGNGRGGGGKLDGGAPHLSGAERAGGGYKRKDLVLVPFLVAEALRQDGYYLRSAITWIKGSATPESVRDRPTSATEMVFLLTKSPTYFYDADATRLLAHRLNRRDADDEAGLGAGANLRNWWYINPQPFTGGGHFAAFPPRLVEACLLAGCPPTVCPACGAPWVRRVERERIAPAPASGWREAGARGDHGRHAGDLHGKVITRDLGRFPGCTHGLDPVGGICLDPFAGSGTTLMVALRLGRRALGIDLSARYCDLARRRINGDCPMFNTEDGEED
jgi:DNA modification methylase